MLNLKVYSGRDLQNFLSFLNQCEAEGVNDIRVIRSRVQTYVSDKNKGNRLLRKSRKSVAPPKHPPCHCGKGVLVSTCKIEGLAIVKCSARCGYSEIK